MESGSLRGKALSLTVFTVLCLSCGVVLGNYPAASYPQQNYYAVPAAAHYQPQYQQQAVAEDHRVDEKDYDVGYGSYWYLGMPLLMIPLLLLLCTPFFHKPYDVGHHGWGHHDQGYGYGYGTYDLHRMGMNPEEVSKEEDVTERVLKATSTNTNAKRSTKKVTQAQG